MYKLVVGLASCALILSACGSHNKAVNNQAKQASTQAQVIVDKCAAHASFTKAGRTAFIRCVAPPGHEAQIEQCALTSIKSHLSLNIKTDETMLTASATQCLEKDR